MPEPNVLLTMRIWLLLSAFFAIRRARKFRTTALYGSAGTGHNLKLGFKAKNLVWLVKSRHNLNSAKDWHSILITFWCRYFQLDYIWALVQQIRSNRSPLDKSTPSRLCYRRRQSLIAHRLHWTSSAIAKCWEYPKVLLQKASAFLAECLCDNMAITTQRIASNEQSGHYRIASSKTLPEIGSRWRCFNDFSLSPIIFFDFY